MTDEECKDSRRFCNIRLTSGYGLTWLGRVGSTSMGEGSSTHTSTSRWPPPSTCVGFCFLNWFCDLSEGSELPHLGERAGCGEEQEQWGGKTRLPSKSQLLTHHHQIDHNQNENILHSPQRDRFSGDSDYGYVIWRRGRFPHHLLAPAFISFLQEILHWVDISMWEGNQDLFSHCFCSQLTMSWTSVWRTGTRYTGTTQFPSIFQSSQQLSH